MCVGSTFDPRCIECCHQPNNIKDFLCGEMIG